MRRWWHRACDAQCAELLRNRDSLETELFRLRVQYDELQVAYRSLTELTVMKFRPTTLFNDLFEEQAFAADEAKTFLTPSWEDREGEGEEPA